MLKFKAMVFFLLLINTVTLFAQRVIKIENATDFSSRVTGDNFFGVVFNEKYTNGRVNLRLQKGKIYAARFDTVSNAEILAFKRFTPLEEDINAAETILQLQLKSINQKLPKTDLVKGPNVSRNLKKYLRQYFGFVNDRGNKIIFINCIWSERLSRDLDELVSDYFHVYDGGKYFWQIKVDITSNKLFDFGVNGAIY